jgi:hypothetical protein
MLAMSERIRREPSKLWMLGLCAVFAAVMWLVVRVRERESQELQNAAPTAVASVPATPMSPPPSATSAIETKPKDPDEANPLHGFLAPMFTSLRVPVCKDLHGEFCDYMSCAIAKPETDDHGTLWNSYVVPGKDGPVLICEWRASAYRSR